MYDIRQCLGQGLHLSMCYPAFFLYVLWPRLLSVRQHGRLGVPLLLLGVTPSAPDAVLAAHGSVPPVYVDHGSRQRIFCAVLPV